MTGGPHPVKATTGELSVSMVEGIPLKTAAGHRGEKEEERKRRGERGRERLRGRKGEERDREEKREWKGRERREKRDCMCFGHSGELANKIIENLPKGESQESMLSSLDGTFEEPTV